MKTLIFSTAALTLVGILGFGIQGAWSDSDHIKGLSTGVAPVINTLYQEECGSCHLAYPPGLLPAASWQGVMSGLEDHFGDNAELDSDVLQQLSNYLASNSAEMSAYRRSQAIMSSLRNSRTPPLRITELSYFAHEHREIPKRIIELPEVGSLSQCNACHRYAEQGSFSEDDIWIKGIGHWDD